MKISAVHHSNVRHETSKHVIVRGSFGPIATTGVFGFGLI